VSALRLGAAGCLAALAVLVALLAADVRAWPAALGSGDSVYSVASARASWQPATRLGGLSGDLLGTRDDLAIRRALQTYRVASSMPHRLDNALERQTARADAQDELANVARGAPSRRSSQALTLLGILGFSGFATGTGESQVDEAVSDFTDAVRADPANDLAKFDLELLLRLTAAHGTRVGAGQGSGLGKTGRHGAGAGIPGSGY